MDEAYSLLDGLERVAITVEVLTVSFTTILSFVFRERKKETVALQYTQGLYNTSKTIIIF